MLGVIKFVYISSEADGSCNSINISLESRVNIIERNFLVSLLASTFLLYMSLLTTFPALNLGLLVRLPKCPGCNYISSIPWGEYLLVVKQFSLILPE